MEKHLHFKDEKSDKFWKIAVSGNTHTVTYGRAGSAGMSKTKSFDDAGLALKDAEKLVKSKIKKGYVDLEIAQTGSAQSAPAQSAPAQTEPAQTEPAKLEDKPVVDYVHGQPFDVLKNSPRIVANPYDDDNKSWEEKFSEFLLVQDASATTHFVAGMAGEAYEEPNTDRVLKSLVKHKEALPNLVSLYLNDMSSEECELSWIVGGDLTPVWEHFPNLRAFRVRGYPGEMGQISMPKLESFTIECSGMNKKDVQQLLKAHMPNLTHLELWVGTDDYGGETEVSDWEPLLNGNLFPKLKYLGLRNCSFATELAQAVANSPIVARLETLDMSMGTMTDKGGAALYTSESVRKLKHLDLHHHFMSDWMVARFQGADAPVPAPRIPKKPTPPASRPSPAQASSPKKGFLAKLFGGSDPQPAPPPVQPQQPEPEQSEPEAAEPQKPEIDYAAIPLHSGAFGPTVNLDQQNEAEEYDGEYYYYVAIGE